VNYGQGAQKFIRRTQRHRADVNVLVAELLECVDLPAFVQALLHHDWSTLEPWPQIIRHRDDISLRVVHRQTDEVLPIGEALHRSAQGLRRAALKVALDIAGQAFTQDLGTPLQIAS
jgi:hypothetical protein